MKGIDVDELIAELESCDNGDAIESLPSRPLTLDDFAADEEAGRL